MTCFASFLSFRRSVILGCAIALLCTGAVWQAAAARSGAFGYLRGDWSGSGVIRVTGQDAKQTTERIRCSAAYRQSGSQEINLKLTCKSDSYSFDLTGDFEADASDHITGQWTELTRNVGGSINGQARGSRLLVHAESPALNANLSMVTHRRQQSVSLKAAGGGQQVSATMTLRPN